MSHLAALRDDNVTIRHVLSAVACLGHLHLRDHVHAILHLAEDHVLAVEERGRYGRDEELGPIGVGAGILVV